MLTRALNAGRDMPGQIISEEISIEDAPNAYERYERHETTDVVIRFNATA